MIQEPNYTQPLVSVIMNCLNGEEFLREAIDSVYAQSYSNWEIIFWDNASTDNSSEIAKSYDKRLRYFRGDSTVPLYAARNLGLRQARGEYITFLDTDDKWFPNKLEMQIKAFKKDDNIGLIHTNVEILEHNGTRRILHKKVQPSGNVFRQILKDYRINLQSVMISRISLEGLDYIFDESMSHSGDADLFLRISHDWNVAYLSDVLAQYREHGSSLSATRIEALVEENNRVIDNLSKRYKDFESCYELEITEFKLKTKLSVFIAKWKYSNGTEAREYILKYITEYTSLLFLYPVTFLPYRYISFIWYNFMKR